MSKQDRGCYQLEQKQYWDYWSTLETAEKRGKTRGMAKGMAEGRADEKTEIARNLKMKGLDLSLIAEVTGLSLEEIDRLA